MPFESLLGVHAHGTQLAFVGLVLREVDRFDVKHNVRSSRIYYAANWQLTR